MSTRFESARDLAINVANDPQLAEEIKANPEAALYRLSAEPLQKDYWIYRIVVSALGLAILISIIGAIALSKSERPVPEVLVALGSAAVGALAGLLAPSPAK